MANAKIPTLATIADKAGLSRSTVSLILNGRGEELGIRSETQKQVLEIAEQLNYQANVFARGLAGKRTQTIAIVWPFSGFNPHNHMPRELTCRLRKKNYQIHIEDSMQDPNVICESLVDFARRRVDGLVIQIAQQLLDDQAIQQALKRFDSVVLVVDTASDDIDIPSIAGGKRKPAVIGRDRGPAITQIVEHFARTGRKKLAFLTQVSSNRPKIDAFMRALKNVGLYTPESVIEIGNHGNDVPTDYYAAMTAELERLKFETRNFDAIITSCDEYAASIINYLTQCDRAVPDDVAVVGFNDDPWTQAIRPPLASVTWNNLIVADLIEQRLFEQLSGKANGICDDVPMQFVWRESAG